jgi:hypothetical protein
MIVLFQWHISMIGQNCRWLSPRMWPCALPRLVPLQLTLAPTARVFLCSVRACSLPSSRSPSSLLRSHIILLRSRYSKERGNGSRAGSR